MSEDTKHHDDTASFLATKYEKHVMFSYEKDSVGVVRALVTELAKQRIPTYFTRPGSTDVNASMAEGVEHAAVFVVLQTQKYQDSRKCGQEFNYADQKALPMINVFTSADFRASGWLAAVSASFPRVLCVDEASAAAAKLVELITKVWPGVATVKPRVGNDAPEQQILFPGGVVTGYWKQNGTTGDMTIDFMVMKDGVTRGQGSDKIGPFTLLGKYEGRKLDFIKQYLGKHKVVYQGSVTGEEGGDLVSDGLWHIDKTQGAYHLAFTRGSGRSTGKFVCLTHEVASTPLVEKIAAALREEGLEVWFSPKGCNDPDSVMAALGRDAAVVIPVMTKLFQASQQCRDVMNYADGRGEPMVPVMAEPNWMQSGWLGVIMSGMLWVDFTKPQEFNAKIKHLLSEIKAAWPEAPYDPTVFDGAGAVEGWYEQDGKHHQVSVDHLELKDKQITGKGKDGVGAFTIAGKYKGRDFDFVKQYVGKHSVNYFGNMYFNKGLVTLRGRWNIANFKGAFEFAIQKAAAKPKERHVMLSYQWDIQPIVKRVYDGLAFHGIPLWFDIAGDMKGNINTAMADGVENANVFVCFSTARYSASKNCAKELNYASQLKHPIIPIFVDSAFKAEGWMTAIIGSLDPVVIDKDAQDAKTSFDNKIQSLVDRIRQVWTETGGSVSTSETEVVFGGGEVTGYWLQGKSRGDMNIEYFTMQNGRVRGQGDDSVGSFTIMGTYKTDGTVLFDKQYIGKHLVKYEGTFTVQEKKIELNGKWQIEQHNTGAFQLTCVR